MSARVLVVCTGNICRSPAAQLLLANRLGGADVTVASAGVQALVGAPVDPPMVTLLEEAGLPVHGVLARQLTVEDVRSADLVLTMTREHRAAVVRLHPGAVRRAVLLLEATAAAEAVAAGGWPTDVAEEPGARLAALPRLAARHRGPARPDPGLFEVADPYRRPPEAYRSSVATLTSAVDRLVASLG